ncbi:basic salivary proline-rich protein 1-like [Rhinichthys klamathensis goyatoka]|uniref:basic salivary proline-rich protein 1-like n=1 Tax=Rhinichthys klamathensis goyatoka TaxID=3034132 RepID=UPI0024B4E194|nr:basic salivary proline-rich protein 1-like [Rhinichthys klamathensis goyatoka]
MASFPIGFTESAEQSLGPELSDELTMALAAGEWWAIMEVSSPISEEPEYCDFTWPPRPISLKSTKQWSQNKTQGAPVPTRSQQESPVPVGSPQKAPAPTGSPLGPPVPKSQDWRNLNFSEPLKQERLHQQRKWREKKTEEAPVAVEPPQKAPLPIASPLGPPVPQSQDWRNLNLSDPLKQERLHQQRKWRQKKTEEAPVAVEPPEKAPVPSGSPLGPPVPQSQDWRNLNFSEPLKQEQLHQQRKWRQKKTQEAPVALGSPQKTPVPSGSPLGPPVPQSQDWRNLNFPDPLKQEQLHQQRKWRQKKTEEAPVALGSPQKTPVPSGSPQGAPVLKSLQRPSVPAPKPLRGELLQRRPQASSQANPQEAVVPSGAPKGEDMAPRIPKGMLVHSGTTQGSLVPSDSPKLGESLKIPKKQRQKQREQNIPKGASGNVGVCQPPPKNKICVDINKKVQLNTKPRSPDRIKTSHLDQSSIPPRSQMNRKRALDNAGVDQSPPQKMPRLAIKVKDQELEPGSFKKLCYIYAAYS